MMTSKKHYSGSMDDHIRKLERVMARLGVEKYQYDWNQSKGGGSCWVEMVYHGAAYRFENSTEKSAKAGKKLSYISDLMGAVVYSLEGLARAVEQEIFTLDMLLQGVPALPGGEPVEPCFHILGFDHRPETAEAVKARFRELAKMAHPDKGGTEEAFMALKAAYEECIKVLS